MKNTTMFLFFFIISGMGYAGSIEVVHNGTPEENDNMGNAVAFMQTENTLTSGMVVGVDGEDGMGAIMYYSYYDTDPVYIKYNGNSGDGFGHSITVGYFNDDSYMDIAVGVPRADYTYNSFNYINAGEVYIFFGSGSGPDWLNPQILRDTDTKQSYALFGYSLASADVVDAQEQEELIVGIPYLDHSGDRNAGAIRIFYKPIYPHGAYGWSTKLIHQGTSGVAGSPEVGDRFGWSVAADYQTNNVAVGVPFESVDGKNDAGMVHVFKMGFNASITDSIHFHQNQPAGMAGAPEAGDKFGYAIAIDTYGLMVGVPGEGVTYSGTMVSNAGVVQTIGIDENSLNPTSFDFYAQGNGGFGDQPEEDDEFGYAVQLHWGSACRASNQCWTVKHMAVGVPGENNNRGLLQISHDGFLNVHQNHLNNASRNVGDRFGNAIAVSLNWRDYLVGVPNEDLNDHSNAGVAHYIEINSRGEIEDNRLLVQ